MPVAGLRGLASYYKPHVVDGIGTFHPTYVLVLCVPAFEPCRITHRPAFQDSRTFLRSPPAESAVYRFVAHPLLCLKLDTLTGILKKAVHYCVYMVLKRL